MTIVNYMLKPNSVQSDTSGFDVADMTVGRPLMRYLTAPNYFASQYPQNGSQASFCFYSVNAQGRKTANYVIFKVRITIDQRWLQNWKRNSYLFKCRIKAPHNGVNHSKTHKIKRGIVYKLFLTLMNYSPSYQGVQDGGA